MRNVRACCQIASLQDKVCSFFYGNWLQYSSSDAWRYALRIHNMLSFVITIVPIARFSSRNPQIVADAVTQRGLLW